MGKFESKILYILLIGILLCSVQAIAAADVGDTDDVFDLSSDIENIEADSIDDVPIASEDLDAEDSDILEASESEEILSEGEGTFTELNNNIRNAPRWGTYELDKDYTKQSGESNIQISKSITIDGKGHTLDGNFISGGILDTSNSLNPLDLISTITLKNINFVNSAGTAIYAGNYHIIIENCKFDNCNGTGSSGGAIELRGNRAEISDSTFTNCVANNGGAIYTVSDTIIDGCTFKGNNASTGSAIYNAIGLLSTNRLSIYDSTILENQAEARSLDIDTDAEWWSTSFHEFDITFEGRDNLINGIYTQNGHTSLTRVTYHSENGEEEITSTFPTRQYEEAGINITLCITYRDGTPVLNTTKMTDADGLCKFNSTLLIDELQLEPGEYTAYAVHEEDSYYTGIKSRNMNFECVRGYYKTNVSDEEIEGYPEQKGVEVTFDVNRLTGNKDAVKNGTVYVVIDDEKYTATVEDGKATLKINLPKESGEFNVTYDGTGTQYYWNSTGTLKINIIPKIDPEVTVRVHSIYVGQNEILTYSVTSGATGTVNITITGDALDAPITYLDEEISVTGIVVSGLAAGDYTVKVEYSGDYKYNKAENTATFTVSKIPTTINNVSESGKPGESKDITFTVKTDDGADVTNGTVKFTVDGTPYEVDVKDGKATFEGVVLPNPGNHTYEVSYVGNDYFADSAGELNLSVRKLTVTVTAEKVIGCSGDVVDVIIHVVDEDGNPVTGGSVVYEIDYDSRKLNADGDGTPVENGEAELQETLKGAPGLYDAKASYTGNELYEDAEGQGEAEILKLNTTTESEDYSGKVGDKVDVTADILDQNGKAVQNGTATLTVDGKEYTAEVKDGKAVFEGVELSKNTTATIKYEGNDWYNPSETAINLTVEEEQSSDEEPEEEPADDSQEEPADEPADDSQEEPVKAPVKTVAAEKGLATGNPIAMLLLVLMALVSTISIRRQK